MMAECEEHADRLWSLDHEIALARAERQNAPTKKATATADVRIGRLERQRAKPAAKLAARDEQIAEARRLAAEDRTEVSAVGGELEGLYGTPAELIKHACVVGIEEIVENEYSLNIPRYVDTFEPEPIIEVAEALKALDEAEDQSRSAAEHLKKLLGRAGLDA
jgi:type I restriction enzyme M protein